jgi:hypothetical protein
MSLSVSSNRPGGDRLASIRPEQCEEQQAHPAGLRDHTEFSSEPAAETRVLPCIAGASFRP